MRPHMKLVALASMVATGGTPGAAAAHPGRRGPALNRS
jgi:hypothetical protein